MVAVKTYRADVERDGQFWHIRVPYVQRSTQAQDLAEVEAMARDLIAIMDEVPADSFTLDLRVAFSVQAKRWAGGWELHVDGVGVTQSGTLDDAEAMVRDYIESLTGRDTTGDTVEIAPGPGGSEAACP